MSWSLDQVEVSTHAAEQMRSRGITRDQIAQVLLAPDEVIGVRPGRSVVQRVLQPEGESGRYLFRVFLDVDRKPPVVVTAYRTSQIEKYRNRP